MIKPHGGKLVNREISGRQREHLLEEAKEIPRINVTKDMAKDIENIAHGVFSPLTGFLVREDFENVLENMRLSNDVPWTIPIVLDVPSDINFKEGDSVAIYYGDKPLAILNVDEIYGYDKKRYAEKVYKTTDVKHPGVEKVYKMHEKLVGGDIWLINDTPTPFIQYKLWPIETRLLFKERGWRTVVGFQTRNAPHIGHEYVQKTALTFVDGLFINPLIGRKKKGDFRDEVIIKAYEVLIDKYYHKERALLAITETEMRYAGPREAIHHAIMRKNYGCTHFIVGRDHAGVGNYYGPYEAQEIFDEFPDLGIVPLFFKTFFYCKKCGGVANEKTCPHGDEYRVYFSGTKIREYIARGERPPEEMIRPEVADVILSFDNPFVE